MNNWDPFGSPFSVHRVPGDNDIAILSTPGGDFVSLSADTHPINGLNLGGGVNLYTNGHQLQVDNAGAATTTVSGAGTRLLPFLELFSTDHLLLVAGGELVVAGDVRVDETTTLLSSALFEDDSQGGGLSVELRGDILVDNSTLDVTHATVMIDAGIDFTARNSASVALNGQGRVTGGATYSINSGASVDFGAVRVGYADIPTLGSNGTVHVAGDGSTLSINFVEVGALSAGTALFSVTDQGSVNNKAGQTIVQNTGRIEVDATSNFTFGYLEVRSGGVVDVQQDLDLWSLAAINGGTLNAETLSVSFGLEVSDGGSVNVDKLQVWDLFNVALDDPRVDVTDGTVSVGEILIGEANQAILTVSGAAAVVTQNSNAAFRLLQGAVEVTSGGTLTNQGDVILAAGTQFTLDGGNAHLGTLVDKSGALNYVSGSLSWVGDLGDAELTLLTVNTLQLNTDMQLAITGTSTINAGRSLVLNGGRLTTSGMTVAGQFQFLGGTLVLEGGSIAGAGLTNFTLPVGGRLEGDGSVNLPVLALAASEITAQGNLQLGDSSTANGFFSAGTLRVQAGITTLLDSNTAVLDSSTLVDLGDGAGGAATLSAPNGLTLNAGSNVTGFGTLDTPNNATTPLVNQGHIAGNSAAEPIFITGYMKGLGSIDNVVITGTDAPGASVATLNRGRVEYQGLLEIEIGSTGFDELHHNLGDGTASLGGTLQVILLSGFSPPLESSFEFLTATGVIDGEFDKLQLPSLDAGLFWDIAYSLQSVTLHVTSGFSADFDLDLDVDGDDLALWQDDYNGPGSDADGDGDSDGADFLAWQRQFTGALSPPRSASATVPESSTLILLLTAMITLGCKRPVFMQSCHKIRGESIGMASLWSNTIQ